MILISNNKVERDFSLLAQAAKPSETEIQFPFLVTPRMDVILGLGPFILPLGGYVFGRIRLSVLEEV